MGLQAEIAAPPRAGLYARLVIAHPCKILNLTLFGCLLLIALGLVLPEEGPDFSEPTKGFEPRGTDFSAKLNAVRQLEVYPEHRPCGDCQDGEDLAGGDRRLGQGNLPDPAATRRFLSGAATYPAYSVPASNNLDTGWLTDSGAPGVVFNGSVVDNANDWQYCLNHYSASDGAQNLAGVLRVFASCYGDGSQSWCADGPFQQEDYPFAISLSHPTSEEGDISDVSKLQEVCSFGRRLVGSTVYNDFARRVDNNVCPVISLADALLMLDVHERVAQEGAMSKALESELVSIVWGQTECSSLTQEMLDSLLAPSGLLRRCGTALFGGTCKRGGTKPVVANGNLLCDGADISGDTTLQTTCTQEVNQLVNYIFTYLVDKEWLNPDLSSGYSTTLRYTNIFIPVVEWETSWELYDPLREEFSDYFGSDEAVKVAGVKVSEKATLFSNQLILDSAWVLLAMAISVSALIFHTRMVTLSVVCALQIPLSCLVAYFVFRCVYGLTFFSFLNVNMLFIAVAIGVDDIFIFMDAYKQSYLSLRSDCDPASRLQWTINRAFSAMLVTTLTTAVAFLGNLVSPITTIKLFGIFGATVVFVDFVLLMMVLPPILVYSEYNERFRGLCNFQCNRSPATGLIREMQTEKRFLERAYADYVAPVVTHRIAKWVIFVTLTAYGIVCLTQAMQLKPSESEELQLFVSSHPTEKYDQALLNEFRFESERRSSSRLPVIFYAGVEPSDEGSGLDPMDVGGIRFSSGSLNSPEAQVFFRDLCDSFASGPLFGEQGGCPYRDVEEFVRRPCDETGQDPSEASSCCNLSYPVPEEKVPDCIRAMLGGDVQTNTFMDWRGVMLDDNHYLKAVRMSYESALPYSSLVDHLKGFHDQVDSWAVSRCKKAPAGVAEPFWFSYLNYWDLMTGLTTGAYQSVGVSLVCCAGMLMFVGGNWVVALYAAVSIIWVLMCIIATLMWLGWKMDLIVAIVLSISVGMSVDFVCHMAHAYVHGGGGQRGDDTSACDLAAQLPWRHVGERTERVGYVMTTMGISVTMGAITTFGGGLAMLAAKVNFFFQFGTFLCTAMFYAFLFSVLHFTSSAAALGPVGLFGDIFPMCRRIAGSLRGCCGYSAAGGAPGPAEGKGDGPYPLPDSRPEKQAAELQVGQKGWSDLQPVQEAEGPSVLCRQEEGHEAKLRAAEDDGAMQRAAGGGAAEPRPEGRAPVEAERQARALGEQAAAREREAEEQAAASERQVAERLAREREVRRRRSSAFGGSAAMVKSDKAAKAATAVKADDGASMAAATTASESGAATARPMKKKKKKKKKVAVPKEPSRPGPPGHGPPPLPPSPPPSPPPSARQPSPPPSAVWAARGASE